MKINYLANVRFPSERAHAAQIAHMCQAFAQTGNDVKLYVNRRGIGTIESTAKEYGIIPEFALKTLSPKFLYGKGKLAFAWREIVFAIAFWLKYENSSADLIYSRNEWTLWILSYLLPKERYVYESHEAKYNRAVRRLISRGVPLIVISEGIRDYYLSKGVSGKQMLVAHDAIDETFLEPPISQTEARNRLNLPQEEFTAMYIGGFDEWKGVETFFKTAQLAPGVNFVAIGGKEEELSLLKEKYPQVRFLGPRPYRDLRFNQRAADVLVIPNSNSTKLGAIFTSPLKLFAHLASGVPILAADVQSISTVVDDSDVTFFEPDSVEDLASKIDEAHKGRQLPIYSRDQYSWSNRAREVVKNLSL